MGRFLVQASGQFASAEGAVVDRFQDYAGRYVFDNERLVGSIESMFDQDTLEPKNLVDQSDKAMFYLYVLVMFDMEILNGGVAQFFTNHPFLVDQVDRALKFFALKDLRKRYSEVCHSAETNWPLLEAHLHTSLEAGAAVNVEGSVEQVRWHETWTAFREAIAPVAEPFEQGYYPDWDNKLGNGTGAPGALYVAIAEACCSYIERYPEQFQKAAA
jgi:hypothetical protein